MAAPKRRGLVQSHPDAQFLRQMNGPGEQVERNGGIGSGTNISLPTVDAEKLKARLYSYAPQQAQVNPRALRFVRPTNAQVKKAAIPSAPRLEPLVSLIHFCLGQLSFSLLN